MKKVIPWVLVLLILWSGCRRSSDSAARGTITTHVGHYPVRSTGSLRYWLALHANVSPNYANLADTPFGKELIRATGIDVRFEHPSGGQSAEALNLMIAAGDDMPDIIEYNWLTMMGGPGQYIDDGTILRLNDALDHYAPYLRGFLRTNPQYDRMVKTDDGGYYVFPFIRGHNRLLYSQGLMIRKDWLDELELQVPQTMDDWYNVLAAFRDRKNIPAPFTITWGNRQRMFMPSFGFLNGMYISAANGSVQFGQIQPNYRRWIETMARWYREGLIDKDIMSVSGSQLNQKMSTGEAGAAVASVGSGMGVWTDAARPANPRYEIRAVQYPVLNRGETLHYTIAGVPYNGQDSAAISGKSKSVELAARFLDYGYTPHGHNLFNFGIEGESYTMVEGKPTYTPQVMSGGPNRWPLSQSLAAYTRATGAGPFVQDVGYIDQYYALPEQLAAIGIYTLAGAEAFVMPSITPTAEESREYAAIMQEINTYIDERTARWFLGTEALTDATWDNYLDTINRMNIAHAIAIETAALQRYHKRR